MGGGGLEVSHHREMHDRAMHLAVVSLVVVVMCVCYVTLVVCMEIIVND